MKPWLANFDPQATSDELSEVVRKGKYRKLEVAQLTREGGDDSRPDAGLELDERSRDALCKARQRLSGLYGKTCSVADYVPL
jgi:hypothetical protein